MYVRWIGSSFILRINGAIFSMVGHVCGQPDVCDELMTSISKSVNLKVLIGAEFEICQLGLLKC
jgi:hypothetical protein